MISYLIGKPVMEKEFVTIVTGGVGYAVRVNEKVREKLAGIGEAELFVHTFVREDALELYGFQTREEREMFLLLIGVSGVGPKTGLQILNYTPSQIIQAIQQADTSLFTAVPRVGKKVAQKIIIDLRSKLGALRELELGPTSSQQQEVMLALQSLGFDENSIARALKSLDAEDLPNMSVEAAVKSALKGLNNS